jgi:hypothetical protein
MGAHLAPPIPLLFLLDSVLVDSLGFPRAIQEPLLPDYLLDLFDVFFFGCFMFLCSRRYYMLGAGNCKLATFILLALLLHGLLIEALPPVTITAHCNISQRLVSFTFFVQGLL